MTAILIWKEALSRQAAWPTKLRNGGLALLGYMMGGTFTAKVAVQIAALWLSPRLLLPTPFMLGPMLATAVLCVSGIAAPTLPDVCLIGAQVMVGAYMGVNTSLFSLAN